MTEKKILIITVASDSLFELIHPDEVWSKIADGLPALIFDAAEVHTTVNEFLKSHCLGPLLSKATSAELLQEVERREGLLPKPAPIGTISTSSGKIGDIVSVSFDDDNDPVCFDCGSMLCVNTINGVTLMTCSYCEQEQIKTDSGYSSISDLLEEPSVCGECGGPITTITVASQGPHPAATISGCPICTKNMKLRSALQAESELPEPDPEVVSDSDAVTPTPVEPLATLGKIRYLMHPRHYRGLPFLVTAVDAHTTGTYVTGLRLPKNEDINSPDEELTGIPIEYLCRTKGETGISCLSNG